MVESSNVRWMRSTGKDETFSRVIRIVDLYWLVNIAFVNHREDLHLAIVQHDRTMRQRCSSYS